MESEIAHVRRSDELQKLDSVLHDVWFSLDEISLDEANGTATVPFAAPRGRDIGRHTRGAVDRDHQWVLTVSHVSEFEVQDPDHLIGHSYARYRLVRKQWTPDDQFPTFQVRSTSTSPSSMSD